MGTTYTVLSFPAQQLPSTYRNMVLSKWMRSLRFGNDYFRLIDSDAFYFAYSRYINNLLAGYQTIVRLAVLSEDFDVALGFCVYRFDPASGTKRTVDYIHVQKDMRRQGIARSLMPQDVGWITHLTRTGMSIWASKLPDTKFDPFKGIP